MRVGLGAAVQHLAPALAAKFEAYFRLLVAWNAKMNLTGLDLAEQGPAAIDGFLVEPLVAAKHVTSPVTRMIDIGSGGVRRRSRWHLRSHRPT